MPTVKTPRAITDMSTLGRIIFDPDTIPPTVPSNVVGTPISSSRIDLAWTASTDVGGSGVVGYPVFRNGGQIATASAPAYSDTGLSASTAYQYQIAAVDGAGNVSTKSTAIQVMTQAVQGPPAFTPVQPAAGFVGIAGQQLYTDATQQGLIGRYNLFVMGRPWEGATNGGTWDADVVAKAIKAAVTAPGGMILLRYQNLNGIEEDAGDGQPTYTAEVAARDWRLYVTRTTTLVTPPLGSTNTALVNYTDFVPVNTSLEHPYEFGAKYSYYKYLTRSKSDGRFTGLAAGLASTSFDGVYQDNWLLNPEANGDWDRDGVTEGQGWPCVATPWLAAGQLRYVNTMRALAPTKYVFGNAGDYGVTDAGVMKGKLDGMLIESYFGKSFSWDTQSSFATTLSYYYRALASSVNPHMVVVGGAWPDTTSTGGALPRLPTPNGFPPLNTQWQWARYIAAFAYLGEGMPAINRYSQGYSADTAALDWYDFYGGVNGLARAWLGAAVDSLRPVAAKVAKGSIGVYGVEYANGIVLCNPVGNGTQTINNTDIPGNWKFLSGTQDATRDTGAVFSSVSLPERDGLLLQRYTPGTVLFQDNFTGVPTGNATLTSQWTAKGYVNMENTGTAANLTVMTRAQLPANLLSNANFPGGKTTAFRFTLAGDEVQSRLTWAGLSNTTTRTLWFSWWEYRDNNNKGGEKFARMGSYLGGNIGGNRLIDTVWGLGKVTGVTLFANSLNMHDYGDHGFGDIFSPWPPGLNHFEVGITLSSGTAANGSNELWINGVQKGNATGLQFFSDATSALIGLQLWDMGGWSSTGGGGEGTPAYPIIRYYCAVRIATARQGVWALPAV